MHYWFERRDDGFLHACVGGELPSLQLVLGDGLHPHPPTPTDIAGRCTHYVDHALAELAVPVAQGERRHIIGGNMSYIENRGGQLYADVDYEDDTGRGDTFPAEEFISLLMEYRQRIRASCRAGTCPTCGPGGAVS